MKNKKYILNSILDFGKFKGFTLEEVYKNKPDYITWCIDNLDGFEIDKETMVKLKALKQNKTKTQNRRKKLYHIDSTIDFGRYNGFKLKKVLINNPEYLKWCNENLWFFKINQSIKNQLENKNPSSKLAIVKNKEKASRMYANTKTWNPFVGCKYECEYCKVSFQRQYKRRGKKNHDCYYFIPHVHEERLNKIPKSDIVFVSGFGDISFCSKEYTKKIIISIIKQNKKSPDSIYYLQSKNPKYFKNFIDILPNNVIILITLETNRDKNYNLISKAPSPTKRYKDFIELEYPRKVITIEPIMDFDLEIFSKWLINAKPEYVWLGFNSRPKQVFLNEPENSKVIKLIKKLKEAGIKVQPRCETRGINFDVI